MADAMDVGEADRPDRGERELLLRRYRLLAETTADVVCWFGPVGVLEWASPSLASVLGLDPMDVVGTVPRWVHPADADDVTARVRGAIDAGDFRLATRFRIVPADGRLVWVDAEIQIERGPDGEVVAFGTVLHDVTDLVHAEAVARLRGEDLRCALARRESVLSSLMDPTVVVEAIRAPAGTVVDFRYSIASASAIEFFGIPFDDLALSSMLLSFRDQRSSGLFDACVRAVETQRPLQWTARPLPHTRSGTTRLYDMTMAPSGDDLAVTWRDVTDEVTQRRDLADSLAFSRAVLDASPIGIVVHRSDGSVHDANAAAADVLGLTHRQLLGWEPPPTGWRMLGEDGSDRAGADDPVRIARERCEPVRGAVAAVRHPSGAISWLSINAEPFGADPAPGRCGVVATYTDVTHLRLTLEAAAARASDASTLVETGPDLVLKIRLDGTIVWASHAAVDLLGVDPADLVGRRNVDLVHPVDRPGFASAVAVAVRTHEPTFQTVRVQRGDGTWVWVSSAGADAPVAAGSERYRVVRLRNVDSEVNQTEALIRLAGTDQLTGAASRSFGMAKLAEILRQACATGASVAVLFADLDGFKEVNDRHGHLAGDAVLREVARRIGARLRHSDLVIRFGGDEFLIALTGIGDLQHAAARAESLREAANDPMEIGDLVLFPTLSWGVTLAGHDSDSLAAAIERCDAAMYRSKAAGGNRVEVDPSTPGPGSTIR